MIIMVLIITAIDSESPQRLTIQVGLFPSPSNATHRSHKTDKNSSIPFLMPNLCLGVLQTRLPYTVRAGEVYGTLWTFQKFHGTT